VATIGQKARSATGLRSTTPPAPAARRRRRAGIDALWGYLLIAPLGLGMATFYVWPAVRTLYFSFTEWGAFGGHTWTGLDNWRNLVTDAEVLDALANTFVYAAVVLAGIPIAVALAALVNQHGLRGKGFYRTLYFLPVVTMPTAVALVWGWIYNGQYGLLNYLLSLVGIDGPAWAADPDVAIYAVAVVALWMELGYSLVIFLAGLQGIPRDYYEAAELDGAGPVRQFLSVTVPLLTPSIFFVSVLSLITSLQAFDLIYVMLGPGNPATAESRTIVYLFYEQAFLENERGYAAAIALVLLAIIGILTFLQFRLQKKWVHYA
jgi:multiple sugar transport system permease protein